MCKLGIMMYMKKFGKSKGGNLQSCPYTIKPFTNHATNVLLIEYFKHI
jgi:hypothetical protein